MTFQTHRNVNGFYLYSLFISRLFITLIRRSVVTTDEIFASSMRKRFVAKILWVRDYQTENWMRRILRLLLVVKKFMHKCQSNTLKIVSLRSHSGCLSTVYFYSIHTLILMQLLVMMLTTTTIMMLLHLFRHPLFLICSRSFEGEKDTTIVTLRFPFKTIHSIALLFQMER